MRRKVVAVDFDGTVVENEFPKVGAPKWNVINKIREWHEQGHVIVIWTCRSDQTALDAMRFLNENNVPFDYFNEYPLNSWGCWTRKVFADVYLDDRALNVADIDNFDLDTETVVDTTTSDDIQFLLGLCDDSTWRANDFDRVAEIKERYGL